MHALHEVMNELPNWYPSHIGNEMNYLFRHPSHGLCQQNIKGEQSPQGSLS